MAGPLPSMVRTLPPGAFANMGPVPISIAGPQDWLPDEQDRIIEMPVKKAVGAANPIEQMRPQSMILAVGLLVMFLLLVIPTWNCIGMLDDPVFMFVAGSKIPTLMLACCAILFVAFSLTLVIFSSQSQPDVRTEQAMLMIATLFLTALGIMLILFGGPLQGEAVAARQDFNFNCRHGAKTSQLYIAGEQLESLRAMPHCASQATIEDCYGFDGYAKMQEALVLKAMESRYQCSGVCQGMNKKGEQIYPPTLFSQASYKVSCDGMAARHIKNFNEEIAFQTIVTGCLLVAAGILISFGQLFGFCAKADRSEETRSGKTYGATL